MYSNGADIYCRNGYKQDIAKLLRLRKLATAAPAKWAPSCVSMTRLMKKSMPLIHNFH